MGPAATLDLQQKILSFTPAVKDQDHVPTIVWNVPQIPDRLAAISGSGPSPLPDLLHAALTMQGAGATAIAMPCNTAHYWANELVAGLTIPLLHIAEAVMADMPPNVRKIALLSTPATIKAGFYQSRMREKSVQVITPSGAEAERLMRAIHCVKSGRTAEGIPDFLAVADALLGSGADCLLLACTELPLLSPGTPVEAQCLDPTAALARACIRHAFEETLTRGAQLA